MGFPLVPQLGHFGLLRAVLACIYAPGKQPEDYLVQARRSDLAAQRATELLKARSEADETLRIARSKLATRRQEFERDEADLRIFLRDTPRPSARRVLGLFTLKTPELCAWEARRAALEDAAAASASRHRYEQERVKTLEAKAAHAAADLRKQEAERDALREDTVRAAVFLLLHHQAAENLPEAQHVFDDARGRARGDRRLFVARVFVEALTQGPAAAFALVREWPEVFAGGKAPEAALSLALVRFASGNRLTPHDLPPTAPDNYSAPEHFALHAFLAAASGLPAGGEAPEAARPLAALAAGWQRREFPEEALVPPPDWTAELPRTELLLAALLREDRPREALAVFRLHGEELVEAWRRPRKGAEAVRARFARLADLRIRFGPLFAESGERCLCLLMLALHETVSPELYALAREELRLAACGNAYELLRAREENRPARFRRVPEELYGEE